MVTKDGFRELLRLLNVYVSTSVAKKLWGWLDGDGDGKARSFDSIPTLFLGIILSSKSNLHSK